MVTDKALLRILVPNKLYDATCATVTTHVSACRDSSPFPVISSTQNVTLCSRTIDVLSYNKY